MMPEGRWSPAQRPEPAPAEPAPAVDPYRTGYRDGVVDALADVMRILNSLPPEPGSFADAYRRIGEHQRLMWGDR